MRDWVGSSRVALWLMVLSVMFGGELATEVRAQGAGYVVGAEDVLEITVSGQNDLTRRVTVSPDGTFMFPFVGSVSAAGLTPNEVETRLRDLLEKDYLVDPQLSVRVAEYRSQRVYLFGEIQKPGIYVLTERQPKLLDIVSAAGGLAARAGREAIIVPVSTAKGGVTPASEGDRTIRVNLRKLLEGDAAENVTLRNGDTIYISKLTSFFVLGEVGHQGTYALEQDTTTLEAITLAGGFTDRAAPSNARILRKHADGRQETISVDLSESNPAGREVLLVQGDTLLIPRGNTFFMSGEVRNPGVYPLTPSTTVFVAITLAGGLTERAGTQVKLMRRLPSGEEQTEVLDLSGAASVARNRLLQDSDIVVVPVGSVIFVLGEVHKPGAHTLSGKTTAFNAIGLAGGFTSSAAAKQVKLIRRLPTGEDETIMLDLSGEGGSARDFPVQEGDTLMALGKDEAQFYVLGEVASPGAYRLDSGMTALQGVARAGGLTQWARANRIQIIRTRGDEGEQTLKLDLRAVIQRRVKDLPLMANDVIVVP